MKPSRRTFLAGSGALAVAPVLPRIPIEPDYRAMMLAHVRKWLERTPGDNHKVWMSNVNYMVWLNERILDHNVFDLRRQIHNRVENVQGEIVEVRTVRWNTRLVLRGYPFENTTMAEFQSGYEAGWHPKSAPVAQDIRHVMSSWSGDLSSEMKDARNRDEREGLAWHVFVPLISRLCICPITFEPVLVSRSMYGTRRFRTA